MFFEILLIFMKKFLIKIGIFIVICLSVAVAIEFLLFTQTNDYSYKRKYVEQHINDIEILFLGNSHIEYAVKPELVGKNTFNMAISGRSNIYDVEIAKRYIPQMHNLKVVFMPLDYICFSFGRGQKNVNEKRVRNNRLDDFYKCMYTKYMGTNVDPFYYWSEIIFSPVNYMSRFFKREDENRECNELGYIPLDINCRCANWEYLNMPPFIDINKPIAKEQFLTLKDRYSLLAALTKQFNVRLILLGTPMYETYQKDLNPIVLEEILSFVEILKKDYDNIEYYDFTFDTDFLPNDFNDASHLNDFGAEKFSKKLRQVVEM